MFSTLIPDHEGKIIFRGDILGRWEDEKWVVFGVVEYASSPLSTWCGRYYLADKDDNVSDWGFEDDGSPENWDKLTIIGNRFDNADILEGVE